MLLPTFSEGQHISGRPQKAGLNIGWMVDVTNNNTSTRNRLAYAVDRTTDAIVSMYNYTLDWLMSVWVYTNVWKHHITPRIHGLKTIGVLVVKAIGQR